jgi:hypothetical protein
MAATKATDVNVALELLRPIVQDAAALLILACPECGGDVELVTDGMIGELYHPPFLRAGDPLPFRWKLAPFGACTSCEFCIEVRP